jgi:hypothetical protein
LVNSLGVGKFRAMFLGHFALGFAAKPLVPRRRARQLFRKS